MGKNLIKAGEGKSNFFALKSSFKMESRQLLSHWILFPSTLHIRAPCLPAPAPHGHHALPAGSVPRSTPWPGPCARPGRGHELAPWPAAPWGPCPQAQWWMPQWDEFSKMNKVCLRGVWGVSNSPERLEVEPAPAFFQLNLIQRLIWVDYKCGRALCWQTAGLGGSGDPFQPIPLSLTRKCEKERCSVFGVGVMGCWGGVQQDPLGIRCLSYLVSTFGSSRYCAETSAGEHAPKSVCL